MARSKSHRGLYITILIIGIITRIFFYMLKSVDKMAEDMPVENIDVTRIADGKYEGEAHLDPVMVITEVTVKDGKIEDIYIKEHRRGYGEKAEKTVVEEILNTQKMNVDVVSGATISSKAIMKSVENALKTAVKKPL